MNNSINYNTPEEKEINTFDNINSPKFITETVDKVSEITTKLLSERILSNIPPFVFERNEFGLLKHINYVFNEDGSINWRAMVPKEYLYINPNSKTKIRLEKQYNKKYEELDIEKDKIQDKDLIILLGGIKLLGQLRGFKSVEYRPIIATDSYASTVCSIIWTSNYETENKEIKFESLACASLNSTSGFGKLYLVEISENRSFCRAIRNFLKINIVSNWEVLEDKIEDQENNSFSNSINPTAILDSLLKEKNKTFEDLKSKFKLNYSTINDIPKSNILELIDKIKNVKIKQS